MMHPPQDECRGSLPLGNSRMSRMTVLAPNKKASQSPVSTASCGGWRAAQSKQARSREWTDHRRSDGEGREGGGEQEKGC